jgi:hypothetical protein
MRNPEEILMNTKDSRVVVGALFCISLLLGCSSPGVRNEAVGQPHMEAALARLQEARSQLQMAKHNKGGHREEAIRLVELAIEEVNRGIQVGERD